MSSVVLSILWLPMLSHPYNLMNYENSCIICSGEHGSPLQFNNDIVVFNKTSRITNIVPLLAGGFHRLICSAN